MNRLFLIFFSIIEFRLFAPPKTIKNESNKEIRESKECQKTFMNCSQESLFLYNDMFHITNGKDQTKQCDTIEKKVEKRMDEGSSERPNKTSNKTPNERPSIIQEFKPLTFPWYKNNLK